MDRRKYIQSMVTAGALAFAGCQTMPGESSPNETPPTEQPPVDTIEVTDYSFEQIPADDAPDEPSLVVQNETEYQLTGQTRVKNGCMYLDIASAPEMVDSDPLTVGVTIDSKRNDSDACTQAIVPIGFNVTFTTDIALEQLQLTVDAMETDTTILEPSGK